MDRGFLCRFRFHYPENTADIRDTVKIILPYMIYAVIVVHDFADFLGVEVCRKAAQVPVIILYDLFVSSDKIGC